MVPNIRKINNARTIPWETKQGIRALSSDGDIYTLQEIMISRGIKTPQYQCTS